MMKNLLKNSILMLAIGHSVGFAQMMSGEAKVCADLHASQKFEQAFPRCLKAASEGDVISQLKLADLYARGGGVEQSKSLAHEWYLRAAKLGNAQGQRQVAKMYRDGIGVAADPVRAKLWLEQAEKTDASPAAQTK